MGVGGPRNFSNNFNFQPPSAALEHIVLSNSKQYFNNYPKYPNFPQTHNNAGGSRQEPIEKWKAAASKVGAKAVAKKKLIESGDDSDEEFVQRGCCNTKRFWWSPNQDSLTVSFCNETSIHGFKFLGQPKRHISERIFWLLSFLGSLALCIYLIYGVWERNHNVPVIVSFQSKEQGIDSIPFPAVTLCNINKFPKSKVAEIQKVAKKWWRKEEYEQALQQLKFIKSACSAQESFAKEFHYAYSRGSRFYDDNGTIPEDAQGELIDFLIKETIPCEELIRLCILGEEIRNCSELFRPVITDYGKCCVFNIMPLPLLLRNPQNSNEKNATFYDNPVLGTDAEKFWPRSEIEEWLKWEYDDGFVLDKNLTKPWKQKRAGLPYGLSILVDPNTEDYFCPVSDSEGIRYILHTPLEMPHVAEFASVAHLGKEVLIEVHPDMTNADNDIRDFDIDKRLCFFGKEKSLRFFGPYTGGNCVDECTAVILGESCKCTYFYMPRDDGVRICDTDPGSQDHECIEKARIDLQRTLNDKCGHCDSLCEDIAYNYETTIADLQDKKILWHDLDPKYHGTVPPPWADHKMSIIHIFFGAESTVPKYRKRLYGTTDLIANTGGILGLCLGFSVLSGIEVLYFLTIRAFWKYCRRRMIGRRVANRFVKLFKSKSNNDRTINVNPNMVPVYPRYPNNGYGSNNGPFYGGMPNKNMGFMPMANMYGGGSPYGGYY